MIAATTASHPPTAPQLVVQLCPLAPPPPPSTHRSRPFPSAPPLECSVLFTDVRKCLSIVQPIATALKKINNRWFVLKGNILFYYKAVGEFESQKDPTGFICLEDYGVESEPGSAVFKLTSLHGAVGEGRRWGRGDEVIILVARSEYLLHRFWLTGTGSGQKEFVLEAASLAEVRLEPSNACKSPRALGK